MLFGCLLLAVSTLRPVAHWDVVPYQRVSEPFQAGVVAFYDRDFKVEFSVNGKKTATVDRPSVNERTRVNEHWFTLDVSKLDDGPVILSAKVSAADGTSCDLPPLTLYANRGNTQGSTKVIWLDQKDGIDYSEGTQDRPVKSLKQALARAGDGGTIYLARPGVYRAERLGGNNNRRFWTTITPAPGLSAKDVKVKGGRTGCDKLCFRNLQLFCDITGGQGYVIAGVDGNSVCWLDNCRVFNKQGRSAAMAYVFGNKLTGYVTGGATTEMGSGPCCRLLRNHVIKNISADAFTASDCLAVNCKVIGVESNGVVDEPTLHRSQPLSGEWFHDVILANITATDCACNGFSGARLMDSVFSDITFEGTGPERRFVSRYSGEMKNVWFNRVKVSGQKWNWFRSTNHTGDYEPTDVRVTDCSFELPTLEKNEF